MTEASDAFGPFEGRVWLNAAHQGPLPRRGQDLASDSEPELRDDLGASRYEVFGTANFFSFVPWTAALDVLDRTGIVAIAEHDQRLIDLIVQALDGSRLLRVLSPIAGPARSTISVISHADTARNRALFEALHDAGVDVAMRAGSLRLSPHLYNDDQDIDRALSVLAKRA